MSVNYPQVLTTIFQLDSIGGFKPAYGTGGYEYYALSESVELCKTTDNECVFIKVDDPQLAEQVVRIIHIKGDLDRIKQLVKSEIDHFDSEVVWI